MDLSNKEIIHKIFGEGKIISHIDEYLKIQFGDLEKNFVYPDAFKTFLKFKNQKDAELLLPDILDKFKTKQREIKVKEELIKKKRILKIESYRAEKKSSTKSKSSRFVRESSNLAFRCDYCDGGKTIENIGFNGVCSDENIKINIEEEKNAWCKSNRNHCFKYHNNEITRQELDAIFEKDDFICYESMMLRDWKAYAGTVMRGENQGKPKKIGRAEKNSLCILTTCEHNKKEDSRIIFGVFLIGEAFKGDAYQEGYVAANSKYKIQLSKEESDKLLFWNYYANSTNPHNVLWNSGSFRYFHNIQAAQILRDIVEIKSGTEDQELAKDFYKYYCEINRINADTLGELSGALRQSEPAK